MEPELHTIQGPIASPIPFNGAWLSPFQYITPNSLISINASFIQPSTSTSFYSHHSELLINWGMCNHASNPVTLQATNLSNPPKTLKGSWAMSPLSTYVFILHLSWVISRYTYYVPSPITQASTRRKVTYGWCRMAKRLYDVEAYQLGPFLSSPTMPLIVVWLLNFILGLALVIFPWLASTVVHSVGASPCKELLLLE